VQFDKSNEIIIMTLTPEKDLTIAPPPPNQPLKTRCLIITNWTEKARKDDKKMRACVVESGIRLPESPRSLQIDLRA